MGYIVVDRETRWEAETPEMFSATRGAGWRGLKHHLVVEALPEGGWDWAAWANDGSGRALQGRADTRAAAMLAAERAAALLARAHHPVPVSARDCQALN